MNDIQQKILDLRREYQGTPLDEQFIHGNPMHQFERWLAEAIEAGLPEPTAMTLSTVDAAGKPSSRIVLAGRLQRRRLRVLYELPQQKRRGSSAQSQRRTALFLA